LAVLPGRPGFTQSFSPATKKSKKRPTVHDLDIRIPLDKIEKEKRLQSKRSWNSILEPILDCILASNQGEVMDRVA
jgi:hypothetical protein